MSATHEWLKLAEDDLRATEVLLREGIFNMACFHSQQLAEKSLKAFLRHHGKAIPFIHFLEELCERCSKIDSSFTQIVDACIALDIFYQPARYPEAPTGSLPEGMPNRKYAEDAQQKALGIFAFVRQKVATPIASQENSTAN